MNHRFPVILGAGAVRPEHGLSGPDAEASLKAQVKELSSRLPASSLRRLPLYARMAILASLRAADSAGVPVPGLADASVVIGSAHSCQKTALDFMDSILDDGPQLSSPLSFSHAVNNMAAGLLSLNLGVRGSCCTVNNGTLSLAGALETAFARLCTGRASLVLAGVADECDARFAGMFPEQSGEPGACFFLLGMRDEGASLSVDWTDHPEDGGPGGLPALGAAFAIHDAWTRSENSAAFSCEPWADAGACVHLDFRRQPS